MIHYVDLVVYPGSWHYAWQISFVVSDKLNPDYRERGRERERSPTGRHPAGQQNATLEDPGKAVLSPTINPLIFLVGFTIQYYAESHNRLLALCTDPTYLKCQHKEHILSDKMALRWHVSLTVTASRQTEDVDRLIDDLLTLVDVDRSLVTFTSSSFVSYPQRCRNLLHIFCFCDKISWALWKGLTLRKKSREDTILTF